MIFVGAAKNRSAAIEMVCQYTAHIGFANFVYISDRRKNGEHYHRTNMDYAEYINHVRRSKCILDVVDREKHHGHSLRVLESLFFKKKLITNDAKIKKETFYYPQNIYVFDENRLESLYGVQIFMDESYQEVDGSYIDHLNIYQWSERVRNEFERHTGEGNK